jgi:hypothetical protein
MGGYGLAVFQQHIRHEALVAPQQDPFRQLGPGDEFRHNTFYQVMNFYAIAGSFRNSECGIRIEGERRPLNDFEFRIANCELKVEEAFLIEESLFQVLNSQFAIRNALSMVLFQGL